MTQGSQALGGGGPLAASREAAPAPSAVQLRRTFGRDWATAWPFLAPCLLVIVGLIAYPFFSAILLSFQTKLVGSPGVWVGFQNYYELLYGRDLSGIFRQSVIVSAIFVTATQDIIVKGTPVEQAVKSAHESLMEIFKARGAL